MSVRRSGVPGRTASAANAPKATNSGRVCGFLTPLPALRNIEDAGATGGLRMEFSC